MTFGDILSEINPQLLEDIKKQYQDIEQLPDIDWDDSNLLNPDNYDENGIPYNYNNKANELEEPFMH